MLTLDKDQKEAARRMAECDDLPNFSTPGTGKTFMTLESLRLRPHLTGGLVLAPPIALQMWKEEIENWLGATASVATLRGGKMNADFHVASYGSAAGKLGLKLRDTWMRRTNSALINDESHYLRNPEAKRTQAVIGARCDLVGSIAETFETVHNLTGTPVKRHNDDMWAQIAPYFGETLAFHHAETYELFRRKFCVMKHVQHHPRMQPKWSSVADMNTPLLNSIVYGEIGAIRLEEVAGLKWTLAEPTIALNYRELDEEQKLIVKEFSKLAPEKVVELLTSNDKAMSACRRSIGMLKAHAIIEHILDAASSEQVLVGYKHTAVGEYIEDAARKASLRVQRVWGGSKVADDLLAQELFNNGQLDLLVGQMDKMQESWNLQHRCHRVMIAEDDPSPATIEQFFKRVARRGQQHLVSVFLPTGDHPVDKALRDIRKSKEANIAKLTKQE